MNADDFRSILAVETMYANDLKALELQKDIVCNAHLMQEIQEVSMARNSANERILKKNL